MSEGDDGGAGRLRGGLSLMPSFVLADLCRPTPDCRQWKGSSVYLVEVLHPSLKFSLMADLRAVC